MNNLPWIVAKRNARLGIASSQLFMRRWTPDFYVKRCSEIEQEFKNELGILAKEDQKMKVGIYRAEGGMFVLRSVQYPDNSSVLSLPPEFTQELFIERANMAFDTLASGLNARYNNDDA